MQADSTGQSNLHVSFSGLHQTHPQCITPRQPKHVILTCRQNCATVFIGHVLLPYVLFKSLLIIQHAAVGPKQQIAYTLLHLQPPELRLCLSCPDDSSDVQLCLRQASAEPSEQECSPVPTYQKRQTGNPKPEAA